MACNSCAKPYSILRKEKGCPGCGFSYCSKCLNEKVFLPKLNAEVKVCAKCKRATESNKPKKIEPPDVYYKRLDLTKNVSVEDKLRQSNAVGPGNSTDQEILNRLHKLKEDSKHATPGTSEDEISKRLQKIKGEIPSTSDAELRDRLAKLRGVSSNTLQTKIVLPSPDLRTEQQQADDLLKQYLAQTTIDSKYKDEFDGLVNDIESRLNKLKGSAGPSTAKSEDEEEIVRNIVEKMKAESSLKDEISTSTNDELPFCEICNEDAKMRCLGCKYLFCKRCFMEHKDDDDGCNRYEPFTTPKGYN